MAKGERAMSEILESIVWNIEGQPLNNVLTFSIEYLGHHGTIFLMSRHFTQVGDDDVVRRFKTMTGQVFSIKIKTSDGVSWCEYTYSVGGHRGLNHYRIFKDIEKALSWMKHSSIRLMKRFAKDEMVELPEDMFMKIRSFIDKELKEREE